VLGLPFDAPPPYVPVDEEYTVRPESTYSLGKAVEEEMARHFARWDPAAKYVALRFSNVMDVADYAEFPGFAADPRSRIWNLWGYIDARDGATATRLALESDLKGFEAFVIASPDTVLERPTAELVAEYFPDVPVRRPLVGNETLLGIDKARRVLAWDPQHSWRS
jgi:nucleoside-diphosphate-sugar epimerase